MTVFEGRAKRREEGLGSPMESGGVFLMPSGVATDGEARP